MIADTNCAHCAKLTVASAGIVDTRWVVEPITVYRNQDQWVQAEMGCDIADNVGSLLLNDKYHVYDQHRAQKILPAERLSE